MRREKRKPGKSGWIIAGSVGMIYGILAFFDPHNTFAALQESLELLKMILPILIIVFFLMILLNSFIDPKAVAAHLGEESGAKGYFIALVGGILSHGPGYVWYPMLQSFREKGAKDGLIVAFIYARSIKIPWLPLMISYFGLAFTLMLSLYIILGALLQGIITGRLKRRTDSDLP